LKSDPSSGKFQPGNLVRAGQPAAGAQKKSRQLTRQLISMLGELHFGPGEDDVRKAVTKARALLDKLVSRAIVDGDMDAIKYIFDRVDGKMMQPLALGDEDEGPYEFTIRIGHRGADGTESAAEVRLRPAVDVPEAAGRDLRSEGRNGKAGPVRVDRGGDEDG
jgi:hypothetical protein